MEFSALVEDIGRGVEALGISIMVVGIGLAVARLLGAWRTPDGSVAGTRRAIGQAILLGLEVLVAGDIIRTVAVKPTFSSVGVLAAIVAIRTFLSVTIELEVTGRLPWQQRGQVGAATATGGTGSPTQA
jgi:uncharacterized membrane protein